jgi:hypothetical protein
MNKVNFSLAVTSVAFCLLSLNIKAQETLVKVEQDELIKKLMILKKEVDSEVYASQFFTIQLYYGKYEVAERIITAFKENYPDWDADLSFETPNYKVQVGRFKQYYNALNKLSEIKKVYPGSFLLTLKN